MVGNPRRRASKRNAECRRALELLAASPDGCAILRRTAFRST
jgi:hypothetical protein